MGFSCQRHICTALTTKQRVEIEFGKISEIREIKEIREFSDYYAKFPKLLNFIKSISFFKIALLQR